MPGARAPAPAKARRCAPAGARPGSDDDASSESRTDLVPARAARAQRARARRAAAQRVKPVCGRAARRAGARRPLARAPAGRRGARSIPGPPLSLSFCTARRPRAPAPAAAGRRNNSPRTAAPRARPRMRPVCAARRPPRGRARGRAPRVCRPQAPARFNAKAPRHVRALREEPASRARPRFPAPHFSARQPLRARAAAGEGGPPGRAGRGPGATARTPVRALRRRRFHTRLGAAV